MKKLVINQSSELDPHRLIKRRGSRPIAILKDSHSSKPIDLRESIFTEPELEAFLAGEYPELFQKMGAHPRRSQGAGGTQFAVWAPRARAVSVVGPFNNWNGTANPLKSVGQSGIWECFVAGVGAGMHYQFQILDDGGVRHQKSDPCAFHSECPPGTESIVCDLNRYSWRDQQWLRDRKRIQSLDQPISIYEVHLGSWRQDHRQSNGWPNYRELARQLVPYCQSLGFTHLELLPVTEHPLTDSWGYQTLGYFAPTSRYGSPEDFMYFVDYCHQHKLGIILDWVPAHFPRDEHGLVRFDGQALYEYCDPRLANHPDWKTLVFDYGRSQIANFLISSALFWLERYHVDGLRVDAVASMLYLDYSRPTGAWVPNRFGGNENLHAIEFLRQLNDQVHQRFPGTLMIAEDSSIRPGATAPTNRNGLGFDLKWNLGWMNDLLRFMRHSPRHRRFHHDSLTLSLTYAGAENFLLPLSHDEVVQGKGPLVDHMPGSLPEKFANLRLLFSYQWTHPGKKLLFMGNEFGQCREWDCDSSLQWDALSEVPNSGLKLLVEDLNSLYRQHPPLHELESSKDGFSWLQCSAAKGSVLSFLRFDKQRNFLLVAANFTAKDEVEILLGVPRPGAFHIVFNCQSRRYGGDHADDAKELMSKPIEAHGHANSISVALPAMTLLVIRPD